MIEAFLKLTSELLASVLIRNVNCWIMEWVLFGTVGT